MDVEVEEDDDEEEEEEEEEEEMGGSTVIGKTGSERERESLSLRDIEAGV